MRRTLPGILGPAVLTAAISIISPAIGVAQSPQIVLGATTAERHEAARTLVPLLNGVKGHAQSGPTLKPGTAPNSPFTGTQTTLFSFSLSKRSVPVDPRVVAALDRLIAWNIGRDGTGDEAALFDRWLVELEARSSGAMRLRGDTGVCDVACVVTRLTTLDQTWGSSPKGRAEARDELMLEALKVAAVPQ